LALELLALLAELPGVTPEERFGANLRQTRTKRGWSQEELGQTSGLHMTEISRLERAVREPRLSTIVRLAKALGVTPADLLTGVK